jgi:hypothetical protein
MLHINSIIYHRHGLVELNTALRPGFENFGNAQNSNLDPLVIDMGETYISQDEQAHVLILMKIPRLLSSERFTPPEVLLAISVILTRHR